MIPGLVGAVLAAICYGAASVSQALGVRRFADAPAGLPLRERVWRGRWYALGTLLDLAGFVLSWVALRTLPLFLVQSVIATSVAVTAVLARVVFAAVLRRAEVVALGLVVVGLACLAAAGVSSASHPLSAAGSAVLVLAVLPITVAAVLAGRGGSPHPARSVERTAPARRGVRGPVVLAVLAGLTFGGVGIAARVLVLPDPLWRLVTEPAAWALAGYAVLGTACYAVALARGRVTVVASISVVLETTVPAVVGLVWLGDAVRPGFAAVAVLGFVVTAAGCLLLSRNETVVDLERAGAAEPGQPTR